MRRSHTFIFVLLMCLLSLGLSFIQADPPVWITARNQRLSLDPSCKLWLPFYKYGGEQSKIWDQSGNNNHGTITGAVPWAGGFAVAQSSMKISAADGTAFVDFGFDPGWYPGRRVMVKSNTNGTFITGYVQAVGTGETLGTEVLDDTGFDDDLKWSKEAGWTVAGGLGVGTNVTGFIYQTKAITIGGLYKTIYTSVLTSGTSTRVALGSTPYLYGTTRTVSGTWTEYLNATLSQYVLIRGASFTGTVDNFSVKQVLTPSSTGVTIVSSPGSATQNWTSKDATFNYNDSAGYTVYLEGESLGIGWYFDGVDDVVTIPDFLEVGNSGKELTVLIWQKYPAATINRYFIGHADPTGNQQAWAIYYANANKITAWICDDGTFAAGHRKQYVTSVTAWDNKWNLFGFTFNNGTFSLYVNGTKDSNPTKSFDDAITTIYNSTANITVGCILSAGAWYSGSQCNIGEALIFNRALSAQEIRNYYELTRHIFQ